MGLIGVWGDEKNEYDNFDPIRKSKMAEIQDGGQNHRKLTTISTKSSQGWFFGSVIDRIRHYTGFEGGICQKHIYES